jgi:hypothetical protein
MTISASIEELNPAECWRLLASEVDGVEGELYWSVILNGVAELRGSDEPAMHRGREALVAQNPGLKRYFVFIEGAVTGRRFASAVERGSIWGRTAN